MSIFDDLLKMAGETGADAFHSKRPLPGGGFEETIMIGIPEFGENLTQDKTLEGKQVNPLLTKLLPPRDQFEYDLRLLLDLAKATEKERSVMNKLIDRFNGNGTSKKTSERTAKT